MLNYILTFFYGVNMIQKTLETLAKNTVFAIHCEILEIKNCV